MHFLNTYSVCVITDEIDNQHTQYTHDSTPQPEKHVSGLSDIFRYSMGEIVTEHQQTPTVKPTEAPPTPSATPDTTASTIEIRWVDPTLQTISSTSSLWAAPAIPPTPSPSPIK